MSINITHIVITGIVHSRTIMDMHDRIKAAIDVSGSVEIEGHTVETSGHQFKLSSPKTYYRYPGDVYSKDLMFVLGHIAQRVSAQQDTHLFINPDDPSDNSSKHPGLQDLDIWTKDQMFEWIKSHADMGEFITGDVGEYERQQRIDDENHQHDLEHGTVPQGSHGYEEQERHKEGGVS